MLILWIVLAIAFLFVELETVALVCVWFVVGALTALVANLLGAAIWLQVLLFAAVSLVMLLLMRPFLRKYVEPLKTRTNVDAMIGKEAVVMETIDNLAGTGTVKLEGKLWTARSANGSRIPAGMVVSVQSVEGVKAIVTPAFVREV